MNPNDIQLKNLSKSFEYTKFSNELNKIDDIDKLKDIARCYYKLYLKQQEVVTELAISSINNSI